VDDLADEDAPPKRCLSDLGVDAIGALDRFRVDRRIELDTRLDERIPSELRADVRVEGAETVVRATDLLP
jgi:hypothetical protein